MSGDIAEIGIWDINLSASDMVSLSKGYSPLLVKPQNPVAYFPLVRGDAGVYRDLVGGLVTSEVGGSATSEHPRVIYPKNPHIIRALDGVPSSILAIALHYRRMRIR